MEYSVSDLFFLLILIMTNYNTHQYILQMVYLIYTDKYFYERTGR